MEKLKRGDKKAFILKLLKSNVSLTQLNIKKYAEQVDIRLFTTSLASLIAKIRREHIVETTMVDNVSSHGTHAVYKYIRPKTEDEIIKRKSGVVMHDVSVDRFLLERTNDALHEAEMYAEYLYNIPRFIRKFFKCYHGKIAFLNDENECVELQRLITNG